VLEDAPEALRRLRRAGAAAVRWAAAARLEAEDLRRADVPPAREARRARPRPLPEVPGRHQEHDAMTPARLKELQQLFETWKAQDGLPGPDVNRLLDGAGELVLEVLALRRAAWNVLETAEPHVSEEQGLARLNALSDLVGYPRPGGPPPRPAPTRKDLGEVAEQLGAAIESRLPGGWHFTLLLYGGDARKAEIHHMARDAEQSRTVMRRFIESASAPPAKARR
jgi:hypothetical protein